jgi:hypothetical protein
MARGQPAQPVPFRRREPVRGDVWLFAKDRERAASVISALRLRLRVASRTSGPIRPGASSL